MAAKPLPVPTATSAPFWEGLRLHEVRLQHCVDCDGWVFYPRSNCSHCLSQDLIWQVVSGRGKLYTFTIARVPTLAEFKADMPQLLAVVELKEGVRINTVLEGIAPEDIRVGMPVVPQFVDIEGEPVTLLHFTPAVEPEA
jgi:uncharacterized OB-fold protein